MRKNVKTTTTAKVNKDFEKAMAGPEPTWKDNTTLARGLGWYASLYGTKESKAYVLDYLKVKFPKDKEKLKAYSSIPEIKFTNIGFLCRIHSRGGPVTEATVNKELASIEKHFSKKVEETEEMVVAGPSIQERVEIKTREIIGELEGVLDDIITTKNFDLLKPYDWMMANGVKPAHVKFIKIRYEKVLKELAGAYSGEDAQLKEAYAFLKKVQLKKYITVIETILTDLKRIVVNGKAVRKPRKVKNKPIEKQVEKVTYKKSDPEYKIVSINPAEIVGSTQLWIFNTKTRKLGCYIAEDQKKGLAIKGTTIQGFDAAASVSKTVRKPEEILPKVVTGGKIILRRLLPEIRAVESVLNGRLNGDIVIMRSVK